MIGIEPAVDDQGAQRSRGITSRRRKTPNDAFENIFGANPFLGAGQDGAGGIGDLDVREDIVSRTFPVNALGWPALALPCGAAEGGLPASVQLVGRPGADALVLAVGALLEQALASATT